MAPCSVGETISDDSRQPGQERSGGIVGGPYRVERQQHVLNDVLDIRLGQEAAFTSYDLANPRRDSPEQRHIRVVVALLSTSHETAEVLVERFGRVHRRVIVTS